MFACYVGLCFMFFFLSTIFIVIFMQSSTFVKIWNVWDGEVVSELICTSVKIVTSSPDLQAPVSIELFVWMWSVR